ncbi:MAG: hypothetical protein AB7Q04_05305 [Steroidobacteraceae bacterium]
MLDLIYAAWFMLCHTITGSNLGDSAIGVLPGIYIYSCPVGNLMDLLYARNMHWSELTKREEIFWLVMNFMTAFTGLATIALSVTRMVKPE